MNPVRPFQSCYVMALIVTLLGCSHQRTLAGKWAIQVPAFLQIRAEWQFQPDGTWEDRRYRKDGSVFHSSKGTYKLDGEQIISTELQITSSTGRVSDVNVVTPMQFQWQGDDTFVVSDKDGSLTYKRL